MNNYEIGVVCYLSKHTSLKSQDIKYLFNEAKIIMRKWEDECNIPISDSQKILIDNRWNRLVSFGRDHQLDIHRSDLNIRFKLIGQSESRIGLALPRP